MYNQVLIILLNSVKAITSLLLYTGVLFCFVASCRKKKDVEPEEVLLPKDMVITDAEYAKKTDILVYVSTDPSQLNIYNTITNKVETVPLSFVPLSVSISLDANFAVVGHDAHLSHIDLSRKTVTNTFDVSCEALDIVLGNNNWAYVFPKRDQWSNIRCIDLSSGKESLSAYASIYAGSKGKLHPSGKFIYVTDNNIGPSDIHKFNIQSNTAVKLYDSPYHGDYPIEGDLWFSEDGKRVFVRGQTALKLSESKDVDLIYNGTVGLDTINNAHSNINRIVSLDHSAAVNKLYVITTDTLYKNKPNLPYVWIYDATNLVYQKKVPVKKLTTGQISQIEPHFVFVNSKGNQIYVVTKETQSANSPKWSIQIL